MGYWLACVNLSEETEKFPEGLGGWADRPQGSLHPHCPPQLTSVTLDCSESCFRQALQRVSETPELKQESPCPSLCWTQAPGRQDMAPSQGPAPSIHNNAPLTYGAATVCGPLGKGSEKGVGLITNARGAGGGGRSWWRMLGGRKRGWSGCHRCVSSPLLPHSSGERQASGSEEVFTPQLRSEARWLLWSVWWFST